MKPFWALPGVIAAVLLPGCGDGPRDAAYNPDTYSVHGQLRPAGVRSPFLNVYTQTAHGTSVQECCWVGRRAAFRVHKLAHQTTLHLWIYVADFPGRLAPTQSVSISFPRYSGHTFFPALSPGFHDLRVAAPASMRRKSGNITVSTAFSSGFYPSPGGPEYAAVLQSVYFE